MKYIIYCRKSSEDEDRQAQSLETQLSLLTECAKRNNLNVLDILQESRSAKNPNNRPLFNLMLKKIKNGQVNGILVAHIDRLSRNGNESAQITNLLESGQLKEIRTPSNIFNSAQDILYMDINFAFSSYYSRNLSIRVKEGNFNKLQKGEFPNRAPFGYLNKDGKIYPSPPNSETVKKIYELYATGNHNLRQLSNTLYLLGYRSQTGIKLTKSVLDKILKNRLYIGEIPYGDKIYTGIHVHLISKDLFNKVQEVRLNVARPRPKKLQFLYRGFVRCAICNCLFTATHKIKPSKKEYTYYYCTNGKSICEQHKKYTKDSGIEALAQGIFDNLSGLVSSDVAQLSLDMYYQSLKDSSQDNEESKTRIDSLMHKNKVKQNKLLDLLLEEKISQEIYDLKLKDLQTEEKDLIKQKTNYKPQDPNSTLELLQNFKNEAISLKEVFSEGDDEVKQDLLKSALWNFSIKDQKIANIRYKKLYERLAKVSKNDKLDVWLVSII
ncbi:recombinase family protein [Candidatus Dojkabacteria bacterium]|nr:recombinase family protein [Candidatus Dojkabacteria bacterium]